MTSWIQRVEAAHKEGILDDRCKDVLIKIEAGYSMAVIGSELGLSRQRVKQIKDMSERRVRTGKRETRGRPKQMPEEYVIKLTRRQKDSLRNKGLKQMILDAENKDAPYWTYSLMVVLDQIAEQNNRSYS